MKQEFRYGAKHENHSCCKGISLLHTLKTCLMDFQDKKNIKVQVNIQGDEEKVTYFSLKHTTSNYSNFRVKAAHAKS